MQHRHAGFKTLYGVGLFPDDTAVAAGYNGQHLRRELLTDGTGVVTGGLWRDRSRFGSWLDAPDHVTIFPLFAATVPRYGASPGRAFLSGTGGHLRDSDDYGDTWDDELLGEPFRTAVVWFKTHPEFLNLDIGWQAGQFFRLAISSNSGATWQRRDPQRIFPAGGSLFDMDFAGNKVRGVTVGAHVPGPPDPTTCLGEGPRILWTDNFGAGTASPGWRETESISYLGQPTDETERDLQQCSALRAVRWVKDAGNLHFWAVGQKGLVLRSIDGGRNWTQTPHLPVANPHAVQLHGVAASGPNAIVVVGTSGGIARAFACVNLAWSEIPIAPSIPGTVVLLSDVAVRGSLMYAVGRRVLGGTASGIVLKYDPGAQPAPAFVEFPGPHGPGGVPDCLFAGDVVANQILTCVQVLENNDLWVGGTCGRVWQHVAATQEWVEHKTQTDADIRKMSFVTPQRGYFAALGGAGTNQVIVRYQAQ